MRLLGPFLCILLSGKVLPNVPDAAELVRQSVANYRQAVRQQTEWRYTQMDTTFSGEAKTVEVSDVVPVLGTHYDILTARNGQPLSTEDRRKEDQKYEKVVRQRAAETPAERAARLKKYEDEWSFLGEIPLAYSSKIVGEETLNGGPAWIVELTPKEGFLPHTPRGGMLKHIEGRLWIDQQEIQWAKAEAHVIDTIGIGWIVARIGPGARISVELSRVADRMWLPSVITIDGSARVLLVHRRNLDERIAFSDFRHQPGSPVTARVPSDRKARKPAGNALH